VLKFIGVLLKISLFTLAVLVLGNLVQIRGRTVSDQIKTQMSHAERLLPVQPLEEWRQKIKNTSNDLIEAADEEILPSERKKLQSLLKELNSESTR
jgi:hypothetical protein